MKKIDAPYNYNFIDLFAGAGGLSEGFLQAGYMPVAHVEMDKFAAKTLETRSAYYYLEGTDNLGLYKKYLSGIISRDEFMKQIPVSITKTIINKTMSDETLPSIFKTIDGIMKIRGITNIDVIVGGPPCQAYSLVGRAQRSYLVFGQLLLPSVLSVVIINIWINFQTSQQPPNTKQIPIFVYEPIGL